MVFLKRHIILNYYFIYYERHCSTPKVGNANVAMKLKTIFLMELGFGAGRDQAIRDHRPRFECPKVLMENKKHPPPLFQYPEFM